VSGWTRKGDPIGGPVTDPFIPMVAYTEEQSDELAFRAAYVIVQESRALQGVFDLGLERIMRVSGDGKMVSLASSPGGNDGARTTFQLFDETHRMITPKLRKAHETMLGNIPKRYASDAWTLELTTCYAPGEMSVAERTMDYARAVRDGKIKDSKLFFFHIQADDAIKIEDEKGNIIEANLRKAIDEASGPSPIGDVEAIVAAFQDPKADREYLRRVWLNQPRQATERAFNADTFRALTRKGATIPPQADIVLAFDGSRREDGTAIIATEILTGLQVVVGLWEKPDSDLEASDNWEVSAEEVNASVRLAFDQWNVWRFYADPPKWEETVAQWEATYGSDRVIKWHTNQWAKMSLAVDAFDSAIKSGEIHHDGDERLIRHVGNCHRLPIGKRNDRGERMYVVVKEQKNSANKIDAAVAAILSNQARIDAIAEGVGGQSIYERNGGQIEAW
jgi:phage terminase large subunit-like protein